MSRKKKNAVITASIIAGALFLAGCGETADISQNDPNVYESKEGIPGGVYVMDTDGKFYAPNKDGQNFEGEVTSADPSRIVASRDDSKFVPTLYKDDSLVYFTSGEIPQTMGIERFEDAGYTIGIYGLSKNEKGKYVFSNENFISGSTLQESFNGFLGDTGTADIVTYGGKEISVADITKAGTIRCKKKNGKKVLSFLKGTYYNEVEAIADEHVWYSEETSCIPKYNLTKNGFVILELPENFKDGDYISVMDTGLIKLSEQKRPVEKEEQK